MYGYIYLTTNNVNGKKYLGKHKSDIFDVNYKGSGVALQRAISKYGWENFTCELLESFNSLQELNDAEIHYINKYNAINDPDYYNIALGGSGGNTVIGMSNDQKQKFKQTIKDRWNNDITYKTVIDIDTGEQKTVSYKEFVSSKISKSLKGKPKSLKHKLKLSEVCIKNGTHKGANNGMYGKNRKGELAPNFGRHYYNNGVEEYLLYEETYNEVYKDKGFIKGRLQSRLDTLHKDLSERLRGNTYNKGKIRIHKDDKEKCILPDELNHYISQGWIKGRRLKQIS